MKTKIVLGGALLLMVLSVAGCRKESDSVMSYAFKDKMAFAKADTSFAEKFNVFWNGMNANYSLWDFEEANGLDWDAVYDVFYPRFAALDAKDEVTDKELQALVEEVTAPLHDGHLAIQFANHKTGNRILVSPSAIRNKIDREQEILAVSGLKPYMTYYQTAGEVLETKSFDTNLVTSGLATVVPFVSAQIEELKKKGELTPEEQAQLALLQELYLSLAKVLASMMLGNTGDAVELYNETALRYAYLQIPGFQTVDARLISNALNITYTLFKGNIAYLAFDHFSLTPYLNEAQSQISFAGASESTLAAIKSVREVWNAWFQSIQELHQSGQLGGVIIDVRSNGGGYADDYQYALGALLPSGGFHVLDGRFKRGPGRYDYSPLLPQHMSTCGQEHVTVTEPIAVLANCLSVSMSEMTSMGAKVLDNAKLIGTRTWGALCALTSNDNYSSNYGGLVGIKDETPVFCYIPQMATFTLDGDILEGYGVTPDIEIAFDQATWNKGAGPDNQLDRALAFIRTGK